MRDSKTEQFICKANQVHNNLYDYTKTYYIKAIEKVVITCRVHGEFEQRPSSHLSGKGCERCGKDSAGLKRTSNSNEFIEKAKKIHKDSYDYSLVKYVNAKNKVLIVCPIHGEFTKTPNKHLNGQGCPSCSNVNSYKVFIKPFKQFIKEAEEIHKNKYAYVESTYVSAKQYMTIVCPVHGVFEQTPDKHVNGGSGCSKCANEYTGDVLRKTTTEFISEAIKVYGNVYNYSKVHYTGAHENVTIGCKIHGDWEQSPSNHLAGKGCRACCATGGGYDRSKAGTLYYISIDNGSYYKIGITNKTVADRYPQDELMRIKIIKEWHYPLGYEAAMKELEILKTYKASLIERDIKILRNGNTEIFTNDVLGLDINKEEDIKWK